jgi:hypothetical protein
MEMKHTQDLNVYIDNALSTGEFVLHPNDGFDLGLVTTQHEVSIYSDPPTTPTPTRMIAGMIHLRNTCRSGTLEVSKKQWELMGREKSVTLFIKTDKLFIVSPARKSSK